ncbi:MAG: hypothetical protein WHU94_08890 [Thermogemmata sp.]
MRQYSPNADCSIYYHAHADRPATERRRSGNFTWPGPPALFTTGAVACLRAILRPLASAFRENPPSQQRLSR